MKFLKDRQLYGFYLVKLYNTKFILRIVSLFTASYIYAALFNVFPRIIELFFTLLLTFFISFQFQLWTIKKTLNYLPDLAIIHEIQVWLLQHIFNAFCFIVAQILKKCKLSRRNIFKNRKRERGKWKVERGSEQGNSNNALLSKSKAATTTTTTTNRTTMMATWIRTRHPREAITIKATLATHGTSEKNVLSGCQKVKLQRQPSDDHPLPLPHNRVPICMAPPRSRAGLWVRGVAGLLLFS